VNVSRVTLDQLVLVRIQVRQLITMHVRREAVSSSQIEGIQSTLEDTLAFDLDPGQRDLPQDVEEVVN
jgi:Fic family protein